MDEQQQATVLALVQSYATARVDLEDRVLASLRRLVAAMAGRWYDPKALDQFHVDAFEIVHQGQQIAGSLTGSYVDRTLEQMGVSPLRQQVTTPDRLREADPDVEWERPAKEFRRLRATGLSELAAQVEAEARAENLARMDLRLAERDAARQRLDVKGVIGYRRIIHPELSKSGSCGLCVVASDRVYGREGLLPLHNGCNCTVLGITATDDPGLRITQDDLSAIYSAADSTRRDQLQRVRVVVNEHGELGPVLSRKGQNFRDATDVDHDLRAA